MRLGNCRVDHEHPAIARFGFLQASGVHQRHCQVVVSGRRRRVGRKRLVVAGDRRVDATLLPERVAEIDLRRDVLAVHRERTAEHRLRTLRIAECVQEDAQADDRFDVVRVALERAAVCRSRRVEPSRFAVRGAQHPTDTGEPGIDGQRPIVACGGFVEAAQCPQHVPEIGVDPCVPRVDFQRAPVAGHGLLVSPEFLEHARRRHFRVGHVRLVRQRVSVGGERVGVPARTPAGVAHVEVCRGVAGIVREGGRVGGERGSGIAQVEQRVAAAQVRAGKRWRGAHGVVVEAQRGGRVARPLDRVAPVDQIKGSSVRGRRHAFPRSGCANSRKQTHFANPCRESLHAAQWHRIGAGTSCDPGWRPPPCAVPGRRCPHARSGPAATGVAADPESTRPRGDGAGPRSRHASRCRRPRAPARASRDDPLPGGFRHGARAARYA